MGLTTKEISSSSFNDMISSVDRRSEYVENRAGANVRLNNFLTPYTLDDKSSILNAPCGYSNGVYPSLRPSNARGPELVTNGTFDTDSDWIKTNATISNGAATITVTSGGFSAINQNITYVSGKKYIVTAQIQGLSGSSGKEIKLQDRGNDTGGLNSLNGKITLDETLQNINITWTANSNSSDIVISRQTNNGDYSWTIDNISVKEDTSADFDFTRGSAATRVTKDGLIKNVQILSDDLVQNGNFSEIGSELIPDGNFTNQAAVDYWQIADTGGVERATKSLENGFMRLTYDLANGSALVKSGIVTSGKSYKVTFRAKGTANSNFHSIGDNVNIPSNPQYVVSNPTLTDDWQNYEFYVPVNSTTFRLYLTSAQIGDTLDITNISVKEVGQHWNFVGGASMTDNGVSFIDDGTNLFSYVQQLGILTSGRKYRVSFDVIRYVSGLAQIELGSINTPVDISSGVGTYTIESESNNTFGLIKRDGSSPNFDFDISNISIIEITDDTDLPRIDYTNGTGSLLLEPQSTNLVTYSEDFSQSYWSKNQVALDSNNIISPDGTKNASKITITDSIPWLGNNTSLTSGNTYTVSCFVKKGTNRWVRLTNITSGTTGAWFDLENKVVGLRSASSLSSSIESYGNDWYRIQNTFIAQSGGANTFLGLSDANGSTSSSQNGNTVYVWGFQIEELTYATSYIPNLNGEVNGVTRNADVCNNAASSDLINSTEGVLYAEISGLGDDLTKRFISLSDGTNANVVRFHYQDVSNTIRFQIRSASVSQVAQEFSVTDIRDYHKIAISYKSNDVRIFIDGVKVGTDTSATIPSGLDELSFNQGTDTLNFYGNVRSVAVFKEALTDEELAKITSTTQQEAFYEMRDKMLQIDADYYEFGDYTTRLKKLF